jgi:hypothetical protein
MYNRRRNYSIQIDGRRIDPKQDSARTKFLISFQLAKKRDLFAETGDACVEVSTFGKV